MFNLLKRILLACMGLSVLITQTVFADGIDPRTLGDFFHIAKHDSSMVLLKQVFGNTGLQSLVGNPGLFNVMFREFNGAVLIFIIVILLYTVFTSVINMANKGEFLLAPGGKPSMWAPFRMIAAVVLVMPSDNGYSLIQMFMMWVVVQGIGAADSLWEKTIDYLADRGSVIAPVGNVLAQRNIDAAKSVFGRLLCMHAQYMGSHQGSKVDDDTLVPSFTIDAGIRTARFNSDQCGFVKWLTSAYVDSNPENPGSAIPGSSKITYTYKDNLRKAVYNGIDSGFQEAITQYNNEVKQFVYDHNIKKKWEDDEINPLGKFLDIVVKNVSDNVVKVVQTDDCNGGTDKDCQIWRAAIDYGWANAGTYFYAIAGRNNMNSGSSDFSGNDTVKTDQKIVTEDQAVENRLINYPNEKNLLVSLVSDLNAVFVPAGGIPSSDTVGSNATMDMIMNVIDQMSAPVVALFAEMIFGQTNPAGQSGQSLYAPTAAFTNAPGFSASVEVISGSERAYFSDATVHPMIKLQKIGNKMVNLVTLVWASFMVMMIISAFFGNFCTSMQPGGGVFDAIYRFVVVPLMFITGLFFAAGLSLAVYVPLTPFIIFTFGVFGWLLGVIESVIAAPIVALGMAHPEGEHEIFGKSHHSIQMMMNLFFRPSFMIFGMISGIIVSFVSVNFMSALFSSLLHTNIVSIGPLQRVTYIVIYVGLVLVILNKSFSLIHIIPDKILSWIGWQSPFGAYAQGSEGEVRGVYTQGAGEVSKFRQQADEATGAKRYAEQAKENPDVQMKEGKKKAWADLYAKEAHKDLRVNDPDYKTRDDATKDITGSVKPEEAKAQQ